MTKDKAEMATRIVRALVNFDPSKDWDWVGKLIVDELERIQPTDSLQPAEHYKAMLTPDEREAMVVDHSDPIADEIERLEREAAPKAPVCPHCGKEIPRE